MTPLWWAATALMAPAAPAEAPSLVPTLAAWHGSWAGEGQAFGKLATATLDIEPGEAGATRLAYHLRVAGSPPMSYSAEASYAFDAKQRVRGKWTDSSGRTRAVAGGANAAKWWTHWGSADVEIGRSTYSLQADGTLVVNDSVLQDDGSWRVFAMLHYRRKNP
ncbi:hypothetical protein [Sphingopyxis sp.]|uniref:hypothetical protein n=1 Tax=Sphingopyxis sp. TaxID=1908224 RepID=UPI002B477AA5|nr:hypothetical protein [Sphingopyxis sp.]HJS10976.1 hypothetical protein [Sphingopyxis sp.]